MDTRTLRLLEYDKIRALLGQHAATALGKELVSHMRPSRDALVVRTRLAETGEACRMLAAGTPPFGGFRDVRDAIRRAEKQGVLTAVELQEVADAAAGSRRLRRYLLSPTATFPLLHAQGVLLGEFTTLEQAVDRAISANGEILDHASPELLAARRRVRALHDDVQRELQRMLTAPHLQELLQEPIVTQRNGRFCLPVRAEARNAFKGIVHDLSASGQTAFMEPLSVMEIGNDLREAQRREEEEVYRVLSALSGKVGQVAVQLLASLEAAARLDLIFARAAYARALDASEPELNTAGIIDLRQARHPLLEAPVPIDMALGDEGNSALIITGPNTGGKTVTLKTVGLLTMMAQSGMHVPALPGSKLALFEQIFADIGDEQSIEQSLSTFSSHMTTIVRVATEAQTRALILLDEIGAGTDPAEGAALAKAILLELHARGCRVIATTHYGELKIFAQTTEGFLNASVEFDLETLRPTYRVIAGLPGSSNALAISQRLGLPRPLIARARELMGETPQALEQTLKQAEGVRRALDRERTATGKARKEAEETAQRLQAEWRELDAKRDSLLARAREQAQEVTQKTRTEANALLEELRVALRDARTTPHHAGSPAATAPVPDLGTLRRHTREILADVTQAVESLPAPKAPEVPHLQPALTEVSAGQTVRVRSLGHRGTVLEPGHGTQEVEVQVGIMRIRVPVSDLEALVLPVAAYGAAQLTAPPPRQIDAEIHLLGLRAEEAANRLEEYLYDALEWGLTSVRIVHGFGTGALRNVVQDLLRHHPAVRTVRPGVPAEGGGGVTIAELGHLDG